MITANLVNGDNNTWSSPRDRWKFASLCLLWQVRHVGQWLFEKLNIFIFVTTLLRWLNLIGLQDGFLQHRSITVAVLVNDNNKSLL